MRKWVIPILLLMLGGCDDSFTQHSKSAASVNTDLEISHALKEDIASQKNIPAQDLQTDHLEHLIDFSINVDDKSLSAALKAMQNIKMLRVNVPLEELAMLSLLDQLLYLNIQDNEDVITELDFKIFQSLDTLYLSNNHLQHIDGLSLPYNVHTLWLKDNDIQDLSPLQPLSSLRILSISNNAVTSLIPLKEFMGLKVLYASTNQIEDADILKNLSGLENIALSNNPLRSLEFARNLPNLKTLLIANTEVADLSSLTRHKSIETLDIRGTNITSIKPLLEVQSLNHLILDKEAVKDWHLLEGKQGLLISETLSIKE